MYQRADSLLTANEKLTLILNNGFERRAIRAAELLNTAALKAERVIVLKYEGSEHEANYKKVSAIARRMVRSSSGYYEIQSCDLGPLSSILATVDPVGERVVCDLTGLSRFLILTVLTRLYKRRLNFSLLFTEAREYYPRRRDFRPFLQLKDASEAFHDLTKYEVSEIVYSSNCDVQEVPDLAGRIFPNHPVLLIAFLAFKRSRLSCILNQYETNARILIKSVPVRKDLKWRERALDIINFDLIDENRETIVRLPTLDWVATYNSLRDLYIRNHTGYKFNVLLAPLGSKMQTVGAWYFAVNHSDVKVITSTPRRYFSMKHSTGYTDTHLIPMDSVYVDHDDREVFCG
jgi:hypothetical protein